MSKPSMKYNILSLIKDKLDKHPKGSYVYTNPWEYNYIHNRIEVKINEFATIYIFESYGEYPMAALHSIIEDHNGNLLVGMSFEEYFQIVRDNEEAIKEKFS